MGCDCSERWGFPLHVIGTATQLPGTSVYKLPPNPGYATKEQLDQIVYTDFALNWSWR